MNKSLYEILGMKAKNSVFKSVFPQNRKTLEGYEIIEVEPYDDTFLNAVATKRKYDETENRIIKKVYENFGECWLIFYTDYGQIEYLVNEYNVKKVWKLI